MHDHNSWASCAHTTSDELLLLIRSRLDALEPAALSVNLLVDACRHDFLRHGSGELDGGDAGVYGC